MAARSPSRADRCTDRGAITCTTSTDGNWPPTTATAARRFRRGRSTFLDEVIGERNAPRAGELERALEAVADLALAGRAGDDDGGGVLVERDGDPALFGALPAIALTGARRDGAPGVDD